MRGVIEATAVGFLVGLTTISLITAVLGYYVATAHYKSAHCAHLELRAEYDKCYNEFGE